LYILWGLVQQYLLNGYLVNGWSNSGRRRGFAPGLAAALFCLAHSPNWFLMAVTLVGGYACARSTCGTAISMCWLSLTGWSLSVCTG